MGGHGHGGHGGGRRGGSLGGPGFLGVLDDWDDGPVDVTVNVLGNTPLDGVWSRHLAAMSGFGADMVIAGLQPSVVAALPSTFAPWEGPGLSFMYTDSKGLVTTGTGNLIDPIGAALALPWQNPDGSPTSQQDITDAWNTVKSAWPGVQSNASSSLTSIRLSKDALDDLMLKTIQGNHEYLMKEYPNYTKWPADAQMAIHSISWAWGPGFATVWNESGTNGTAFNAAVNAATPDFAKAAQIMMAASQHEESINSGIIPRDQANVVMFNNAADVLKSKGDVTKFWYPGSPTENPLWTKVKKWAGVVGGAGAGLLVAGPVGAAIGAAVGGGGSYLASTGKIKLPAIKLPGAAPTGPLDPKAVQNKLNALGMASPPLTVDGSIGPLSIAAIKAFQASKKLPVTGAVDAATRKALGV
jgi:Putative peptidoglycan binding domain